MRFVPIIILLWGLAGLALAGEEAGRSQVRAATADAVANLVDKVSRTPLTRNLSVGEFVRRTNSTDELTKALQRAQQIGGPRWIDDYTCQIELQISGPVVAAALKRIAAANPRQTPILEGELTRAVQQWDERSFTATGAATSRIPIAKVRGTDRIGGPPDAWRDVSQAAREQAVAAAKADAARRSLASVRAISLTPRSTVGDALAVKDVGDGMQRWLTSQTPARVELTDDMEAVVELSGTPAETYETFHDLALKQKEVPIPSDEGGWNKTKDEFEHRMVTPIGRAAVSLTGAGEAVIAGPKPGGTRQWRSRSKQTARRTPSRVGGGRKAPPADRSARTERQTNGRAGSPGRPAGGASHPASPDAHPHRQGRLSCQWRRRRDGLPGPGRGLAGIAGCGVNRAAGVNESTINASLARYRGRRFNHSLRTNF